jgi:hypothetical protein
LFPLADCQDNEEEAGGIQCKDKIGSGQRNQ